MAQTLICEFDGTNEAILLVTNLTNGDTQKICAEHAPMWAKSIVDTFAALGYGIDGPITAVPDEEGDDDQVIMPGPLTSSGPDDDEDDDADESPAVTAADLGNDPDGDLEGYDGPVPNGDRPGVEPVAAGGGG